MEQDTGARTHRAILDLVAGEGDLARLREHVADEHALHQSVIEGSLSGPGALIGIARFYRRALSGWMLEILDQLSEADRTVTRFRVSARHEGPLGAISPTHRPVEVEGMLASRFGADGRAAESWLEVGAYGVVRSLGVAELVNPVRVVES